MEAIQADRGREEIISRLGWVLFFRVVAMTLLLGATAVLQLRAGTPLLTPSLVSIYLLAGVTYLFSLLSAVSLRWVTRPRVFAYGQVVYEVALITALVSTTGRIFSFVYILTILTASIVLTRMGAFVAAMLSSLTYGGVLVVVNQRGDSIPFLNRDFLMDVWGLSIYELIYTIGVNFAAFFMVAFLSSRLSEQLRRTGQQLREREEDLEELEARSENIIRSLASGLVTLDREGRITSINRSAEEITGREEWELRGKSLEGLFPGLDIDNCPREWTYEHPSSSNRYLNLTTTTLKGSKGQEIGTLLTFQDQTAFKQMEDQLRIADRLAAVGQLAAGLAHEVRNPLASISGSIQLMRKEAYEDDKGRLMKIILRETDRLNQLITEFLHFARPTVGPPQRINLRETLEETIELFRKGTDSSHIQTSLECPENLILEIDPNLLRQIMWNLYINAREAMDGEGRLDVSVEIDAQDFIYIRIEDSGPGIPPQIQDQIFTPFYTTKEYGTGLGLSTVFRSVESLGGKISIRSEPGGGAVALIELPGILRADAVEPAEVAG